MTTELEEPAAAPEAPALWPGDGASVADVQARVEALADVFEGQAREAEDLGQLTGRTVQEMRDSGLIRMLQPKQFGGFEAHPVDFTKAVLAVGSHCGSAGWVAGVVGVHQHELALADIRLQEEIWGQDQDTWVASPYAPMGVGRPVEGGFIFNGHWKFSSGTDHCEWVIIGGFVANPDGTPNREDVRHFVLPRSDYEIVQDSWEVAGLKGTGSKDLLVKDVFVPDYRVLPGMIEDLWGAVREAGHDNPMYAMPRALMFAGTINTGSLAIAQGALGAFIGYTRNRSNVTGAKSAADPFQLQALGKASADIETSINQHLIDLERVYDYVATGKNAPQDMVIEVRARQVRNTHRALAAVDDLFLHAGGGSLQLSHPLQRFWRDLHASMNHICNVAEPMYSNHALRLFGQPLPPGTRV